MERICKPLLIAAGGANILVAMLHIAIIIIGIPAYEYFGAPPILTELVRENHLLIPVSVMLSITAGFFIAGLYAFSGASVIRRLPFLNMILFMIGVLYFLRGSVIFLIPYPKVAIELMHAFPNVLGMDRMIMPRDWFFSFVWFCIGVVYLVNSCNIIFKKLNSGSA